MSAERIKHYLSRLKAIESERSSFMDYWRELSDNILASRGRFLSSDRNKGHKRNTKQINNTPRLAARTLQSGMMAGITSPARPWFKLKTGDDELDRNSEVKIWLSEVERLMRDIFSQSNFYNALHQLYGELGTFGVGAMGIFENFDNVIRCHTYTVGAYGLAANGHSQIDTFVREYDRTVGQIVGQFGIDACSESVKSAWKNGKTEDWHTIIHVIEPNDDRDGMKVDSRNMRYRSVYFEKAAQNGRFLRESGFNDFAIMAPRWDITGEDIYGTECPGMIALGDCKQLQLQEKRKAQALDKLVTPPLVGPSWLKGKRVSQLPGDVTYVEDTQGAELKPLYAVNPDWEKLSFDIRETERRIDTAYFKDLFLMLSQSDRREITAREVEERHEEKLIMLGPVLERLHSELLDPAIDRTFNIVAEAGILPEIPEVLEDRDIQVEYISILAQAQRAIATGSIDRVASFVLNIGQVDPGALDKFNTDAAIDEYATDIGVSPKIIRSDEEAGAIRQAREQQQQIAQQLEAAKQATDAAKNLSETELGGGNALSAAIGL